MGGMNTKHRLMFVALGVLALAGCERRKTTTGTDEQSMPREPSPRVELPAIGGGPVAVDYALSKIVDARCDREMRCGNVGGAQRFADRGACVSQVKKDFAEALDAVDCAGGVDSTRLDECLTDARREDCNNPFDTIGRVASCRTSNICHHLER